MNKEEEVNKRSSEEMEPHKTGRLPIDALLQIWSRLPTQALYRCRAVCHIWNHLISNDPLLPFLRHRLSLPHPAPPTFLLILRHFPSEPVKHPDRPVLVSTRPASGIVLQSDSHSDVLTRPVRNGFTPYVDSSIYLLPSSDFLSPLSCFCSDLFFYVCNPSLNQFLRVSPGHNRHLNGGIKQFCKETPISQGQNRHSKADIVDFQEETLIAQGQNCNLNGEIGDFQEETLFSAGQNRNSTSSGAFGYLHLENRFVIVNIRGTTAEVYEFGPGLAGSTNWRLINSPSPAQVRGFGLMVEEQFFWTAAGGPGFVICLDYKTEMFTQISPPVGNAGEVMLYDQMYLVKFKGSVCAVDNFSRPPRMEIWVLHMNEVKEGFYWVRKYNVFMTGMSRDLVYPFCDYYFYDESCCDDKKKKEKKEMIVLCNGTRSRLYCYNFKSRSIKQVYRPKQRSFEQLGLYTPGLFPLTSE